MNRISQHQGVELHPYDPQPAQAPCDNRVQQIAERAFGTIGMLKAMVFLSAVGAVTAAILAPSALPFFLIGGVSVTALRILLCPSAQPVNLAASLEEARFLEADLQHFFDNLGNDLERDVVTIEAFLDTLQAKPKSHWTERYQQGIRDLYLSELKRRLRRLEEPPTETFTRLAHTTIDHLKQYLQERIEELRDYQDATQQMMDRR